MRKTIFIAISNYFWHINDVFSVIIIIIVAVAVVVIIVIILIIITITSAIIIVTIIIMIIVFSDHYYYYCHFLSLLWLKPIIVTVIIILTWLLIDQNSFRLFLLIHISSTPHPSPPPQKKFFWGNTMEIKPHSFFVLSLSSHLVCFFDFYFTLQFSFWLEKLCKFFIYWVNFCDGERCLLTNLLSIKYLKRDSNTNSVWDYSGSWSANENDYVNSAYREKR